MVEISLFFIVDVYSAGMTNRRFLNSKHDQSMHALLKEQGTRLSNANKDFYYDDSLRIRDETLSSLRKGPRGVIVMKYLATCSLCNKSRSQVTGYQQHSNVTAAAKGNGADTPSISHVCICFE
jgi:hypothetical protein